MRNIDDLVKKEFWGFPRPDTFHDKRLNYERLTKGIDIALEKKKKYDELIANDNPEKEGMSFKDTLGLYNGVQKDNYKVKDWLLSLHPDLAEYIGILDYLEEFCGYRRELVLEQISFRNFGGDEHFDERCVSNSHCLIKIDEELVCAYCGATSKDYHLRKEDFDFLVYCASCQDIFLEEVTKDDLPLLKVLIEEHKNYRNQRTPLDELEEDDYMVMAEEYWLSDEFEISDIRRKIRQAHILDTQRYLDRTGLNEEDAKKSYLQLVQELEIDDVAVGNPKYLDEDRICKLIKNVYNQKEIIEKSDSRFKDLLLWECQTALFEIEILAEVPIPKILERLTDDSSKMALAKAYYNLSSQEGRVNSTYFANENDALWYDCVTASPEINQKILEMKLKRN